MKNSRLITLGLLQAVGVFAYIALVASFMTWGEHAFPSMEGRIWVPIAILLLFSLSAAMVGSLVFGRAAYLFLTGARREGIVLAGSTVAWLLVLTVSVFAVLLATR